MLSRVADSLYWMARYLERAEHTARVIDVQLNLMLDQVPGDASRRFGRLLRSLGDPLQGAQLNDSYSLAQAMVFDHGNRASIVTCIMQARENARQVREQISSEMWQQLNRLYHEVRKASMDEAEDSDPVDFLGTILEGCHLFCGVTDGTMIHGEGWQFIQLGRYLERARSLAILLDEHFREFQLGPDDPPEAFDPLEWIGLLRSCSAFEAYCRTYTADVDQERVAEFLILNPEFPRSIRFSVDMLQTSLAGLPEATAARKGARVSRLAGRLRASLSFTQIEELMGGGIHPYLETVMRQCGQIHAAAYQGYIDYGIDSALQN